MKFENKEKTINKKNKVKVIVLANEKKKGLILCFYKLFHDSSWKHRFKDFIF